MSSSVTREDVEDELFHAGIRSGAARERIMRIVDIYAVTSGRRYLAPLIDSTPPQDGKYPYLLPGEYDIMHEITRCTGPCGKAKKWRLFHIDKAHPSGHKTTCKECLKN